MATATNKTYTVGERADALETRKAADTRVNRDVASDAKLSAGTANDLDLYGHAVSPFTGARLVGTSESFREVSAEEYTRVAKEAAKKAAEQSEKKVTLL